MYRDDVSTSLGERLDVTLRLDDHQVHIERKLGDATQGFHDQRTDGQVRDKSPIHDINVDPICAGA
jgi:hypothetical protein